MLNLKLQNRSGNSFLDYAMLLVVVGMALAAMTIYIKRGSQGKTKLYTDSIICANDPDCRAQTPGTFFHSRNSTLESVIVRGQGTNGAGSLDAASIEEQTSSTFHEYNAESIGKVSPDEFYKEW